MTLPIYAAQALGVHITLKALYFPDFAVCQNGVAGIGYRIAVAKPERLAPVLHPQRIAPIEFTVFGFGWKYRA